MITSDSIARHMLALIAKRGLSLDNVDAEKTLPKIIHTLTTTEIEKGVVYLESTGTEQDFTDFYDRLPDNHHAFEPQAFNEVQATFIFLNRILLALENKQKRDAFFKDAPGHMDAPLLCLQAMSLAIKWHPVTRLDNADRYHTDYLFAYNRYMTPDRQMGPHLFSRWEIRLLELLDLLKHSHEELEDTKGNLVPDKDIPPRSLRGCTELLFAARDGLLGVLNNAIAAGDDVNALAYQYSALDLAAKNARLKIVERLLDAPHIKVNMSVSSDKKRNSTLYYALDKLNKNPLNDDAFKIVKLLLEKKAECSNDELESLGKDNAKKLLSLPHPAVPSSAPPSERPKISASSSKSLLMLKNGKDKSHQNYLSNGFNKIRRLVK